MKLFTILSAHLQFIKVAIVSLMIAGTNAVHIAVVSAKLTPLGIAKQSYSKQNAAEKVVQQVLA